MRLRRIVTIEWKMWALLYALASLSIFGAATANGRQETARAASRLAGRVSDRQGAPVAAAEVVLKRGAATAARTLTDEGGRFDFGAGRAAFTSLVVHARGFARFERALDATAAATELEIVLDPAPLAEEVTVTAAARTETRLGETAASIVLLSETELSSAAALTLDDALRQVPGFQLFRRTGSRAANPTAQGVSLRGTGASGASRTLVLADGVPLNDPFGGWVYWSRVPRASVASVEVVRGGASSLYGSAALGGVVQFNTRRASTSSSPTLSLEASYGGQRTPSASLFASANRGRWGASLAAEAFSTDGYVIVDERERGRVDRPASARHTTLDLMLERRFGASSRVFARGLYFDESRLNGTPLQTNDTRFRQVVAGGDWLRTTLGAFNVRAYGGAQVYGQSFTAVAGDRASETLTRLQSVPSQFKGLTTQWTRPLGARHTLVAGADARAVRGASDEIIYAQGRPASLLGAGGRERTAGFFAEDIFRAHARVFLTFGARFDRWRNYAAQVVTHPFDPTRPASVQIFPDRTETAFSPQASLLYKPHETVSLSAAGYRSFRQPTLNELYRSFRVGDVLTLANERLRAERLTGGEAGLRLAPPVGRFAVRGNFFWLELTRPVSNVTLTVTPALITRQRQNLGRTRSRGLEVEAEARPAAGFTLSGGYLFVDSIVLRFPANTALEGLRLPQTPRQQVTWQARYDGLLRRWTLGYQGRFSSAQFDDDQNLFLLESFATHDAFASLRLARGWETFVAVENLLDRRYEVGRTPVRTIGPPRSARLGIRLRLGAR